MSKTLPKVKTEHAHFLKGHASWLYCDRCDKTVAYLCYVTYTLFCFSFACACGCEGSVENRFDDADVNGLPAGEPARNPANKRFCCPNDQSALFSPVPKNLKSYEAEIVCKQCGVRYRVGEIIET